MNKVAIYARLSREDENKIDGNNDSRSIDNQIKFLTEYAIENNFEIQDVYIDDGYTGANLNRPEFQRLINDAKRKRFNILLVKDLSRLGRVMHQVGDLIENVFPSLNIRVIAKSDNYDSLTYNDDESIVLRTFLNAYYLKDFKKKINNSYLYRANNTILKTYPKYGYKFDENKNIIIDEYAANIVKRIFKEYSSNKSPGLIASDLNKDKILTKAEYIHKLTNVKKYYRVANTWTGRMINETIKDIEYLGTLKNFKCSKKHEAIIFENKIPQIIDMQTFLKTQDILSSRRKEKDSEPNLCRILLDGDSNNHPEIVRSKDKSIKYYHFAKQHIDVKKQTIDKLVFDDVIAITKECIHDESKYYNFYKDKLFSNDYNNKEELSKQLNKYNKEYSLLLESMFENKVPEKIFNQKSEILQNKIKQIENQIEELKKLKAKMVLFDKRFKEFLENIKNNEIDYDLIKLIVAKINFYKVSGHKKRWQISIKITYNFEM